MTYYEQQVLEIRDKIGQKEYVYHQLNLAKQFIQSNLDQAITVDHAASAACFSKFHFLRLFKSVYHCTPHEYLTGLRIQKAKQLLRGDHSVEEICHSIGFSSTSTFKLLFKRYTRHTPFLFRQKMKEKQKARQSPAVSPFLLYYKKSNFRARPTKD